MAVTDGDVVKCVVIIEGPDQVLMQNVYHYQLDDPGSANPSNASIVTALDNEITALYEDIEAFMTPDYTVADIEIDRVEWNVDFWETVETIGDAVIGVVGLAAQNAVPHGVAAVWTANTTRPQTRGRKFFPGIGEAAVDDSTLSGALLTALAAMVVEYLSARPVGGGGELVPVVLGTQAASAGLIYQILTVALNGIAGYQRRRKPGVGA